MKSFDTLKSESAFMEILLENGYSLFADEMQKKTVLGGAGFSVTVSPLFCWFQSLKSIFGGFTRNEKKKPFFILNPTLEDFFFLTGHQLQRVDIAGRLVERGEGLFAGMSALLAPRAVLI